MSEIVGAFFNLLNCLISNMVYLYEALRNIQFSFWAAALGISLSAITIISYIFKLLKRFNHR